MAGMRVEDEREQSGSSPILPAKGHQTAQVGERRADLQRSRELLLRVVDDRVADILQLVQDGLENQVHSLVSDLKTNKLRPEEAMRELRRWVREEERQVHARLSKLFDSICREVEHQARQEIRAQPEFPNGSVELPVPVFQPGVSAKARMLGASISGVVVGVGTWLVLASATWLLPIVGICVGLVLMLVGGLAAFAVWVLLGRRSSSAAVSRYLTEAEPAILEGFESNIQQNARQLKALVDERFRVALTSPEFGN